MRLAPGNRRAHRDVLLPAIPMQEHLEGGEQRHEQRRPFAPAQRPKRLGQWLGQLKGQLCPLMAGHWPAGIVGRQHQRGRSASFSFQ